MESFFSRYFPFFFYFYRIYFSRSFCFFFLDACCKYDFHTVHTYYVFGTSRYLWDEFLVGSNCNIGIYDFSCYIYIYITLISFTSSFSNRNTRFISHFVFRTNESRTTFPCKKKKKIRASLLKIQLGCSVGLNNTMNLENSSSLGKI